jgi:hypothetical protein
MTLETRSWQKVKSDVYPPSSATPIVPFVPSFKTGPNICPLSVLILAAGSFDVGCGPTML